MKTLVRSTAFAVAAAMFAGPAFAAPQSVRAEPSAEQASGRIGLVLAKSAQDAPLVIQNTVPGGPAEAAGLLPDDVILAIDDVDTETLTLEQASAAIRGPVGSWVTLSLLSGEDRFDLSIRRAAMQLPQN